MITGHDLRNLQNTLVKDNHEIEQDYLIEHLDYAYISQCQDVVELRKLQVILESGKEGDYPKLLEFLKGKISEISPQEKDEPEIHFQNLVDSLRNLDKDISGLKDLEKFNASVDKTSFDKSFSKICIFSTEKVGLLSKSDFATRSSLAEREKEKGNECFKAGEYNDAIVYYTRSLQIMKRAHVFTNRANAYHKIGQYEKAENDSSAALEMNDSLYIFKAYIRRAEARRKRGKLWDALQDVDSALKIDSSSSLATNLRNQIEKEYKKMEGDLAKDTRGPKSRIKIEETNVKLEPSSIRELTDEEADLLEQKFKECKDTYSMEQSLEEKHDDFLRGLQALKPSVDFGKSNVEEDIKSDNPIESMLKIQDVEQVDDDIDLFKKEIERLTSKINVTDKENVDDDCEAFQKELGLVNESDSSIQVKEMTDVDNDCLLFKREIQSKGPGYNLQNENAYELPDPEVDFDSKDSTDISSAPEPVSFTPPKSSIEFEAAWNTMKHDIKQFASYLSCIDQDDKMKFLAMVSNADLHIDLILSIEYMKETKEILKLLEFVTTLPRFKVIKSFMTRKQKAQLAAPLNKLKQGVDSKRIDIIFDTFKL